jgi:CDP-4-dehydro-6-deoxyglucose reductase
MYKVVNQQTNSIFEVDKNEFLLEASLRQGLSFPYGCEKGMCGKCKAILLEGQVEFDQPISKGITQEEIEANIILLCQCKPKTDLSIEVEELGKFINSQKFKVKVNAVNHLNHDVVELVLETLDDKVMQFFAGQYVEISAQKLTPKFFSIANAPKNETELKFHIRLIEGGEFTNFVFDTLTVGDEMLVEGPKGSFFLQEDSQKPIILVAGGTGFGPIKSIIEQQLSQKNSREMFLYWGVSQEQDFYQEIPQAYLDKLSFIPVLSQSDESWQGRKGYVHKAVLEDFSDLSAYEVYACGAPSMVSAAAESFTKQGLSEKSFFSDSFEFSIK